MKKQIEEKIKTAMRAKDKVTLSTLRLLKAAVANEEIAKQRELTDLELVGMVRREMKRRQETIELVRKANMVEFQELGVLEQLLPEQLTYMELEKIVIDAIFQTGALTQKDMGKVMGVVNKQIAGKADGKTVSNLVTKLLNKEPQAT